MYIAKCENWKANHTTGRCVNCGQFGIPHMRNIAFDRPEWFGGSKRAQMFGGKKQK